MYFFFTSYCLCDEMDIWKGQQLDLIYVTTTIDK